MGSKNSNFPSSALFAGSLLAKDNAITTVALPAIAYPTYFFILVRLFYSSHYKPAHTFFSFRTTVINRHKTQGIVVTEKNNFVNTLFSITSIIGKRKNTVPKDIPATYKWLLVNVAFKTAVRFKYNAGDISVY